MKILYILILTLFIVSCKNENAIEHAHFNFIEVTSDDGGSGASTVFIDSTWTIIKCRYHNSSNNDSSICIIDTLDSELKKLINSKIDELKVTRIDTFYEGDWADCSGFIIRLGYGNEVRKSIITRNNDLNNKVVSFAVFISDLQINQNQMDSITIFETTRYLVPKPVFPMIKFLPLLDSTLIY
jgi:hypothetical protein